MKPLKPPSYRTGMKVYTLAIPALCKLRQEDCYKSSSNPVSIK